MKNYVTVLNNLNFGTKTIHKFKDKIVSSQNPSVKMLLEMIKV